MVKKAAVDQNLRAQPQALEKLMSPNTILIAASAPTYPHGVLDPIAEIAAFALAKNTLSRGLLLVGLCSLGENSVIP
ncbi:MAG: hypothetical protein IPO07_26435 [Haliscomenobacter sp.]|nr:hypothetical protein [Haliscomenobacter sp.]MBK9491941.1 hypothetical protein [Haliscomenobacter sp.]